MIGRRALLLGGAAFFTDVLPATARVRQKSRSEVIESWMGEWIGNKFAVGQLHVSRFVEPIWYLTKPIGWKANSDKIKYKPVEAPVGFVTDFASIPWQFWVFLRPDGEYTYPAILHDYLYWVQDRSKSEADEIFKLAMEDFKIPLITVQAIYRGVQTGGFAAWSNNARLKRNGEKRILTKFPEDPTTRWRDWKKKKENFA